MKALVLLGVGAISFLITFAFITRDEIGAEVEQRLDSDFVAQCVARAQFPPQIRHRAADICGCMKAEFDTRGLKLTDAFGTHREEMRKVTQDCVSIYN